MKKYALRFVLVLFFIICNIARLSAQIATSPNFKLKGDKTVDLRRNFFTRNDSIALDIKEAVTGVAISGAIEFYGEDGAVRVTLTDDKGMEYLVYETYPLLSGDLKESFESVAMESFLLNNVVPHNLKVYIHQAKLSIKQISTSRSKKEISKDLVNRQKSCQQNELIDILNRNILRQKQPWIAGNTTVSRLNYEEKKKFFGKNVPFLNGFDYYKGGVFPLGSLEGNLRSDSYVNTVDSFIPDFDWRNRHGKNWITPVVSQSGNTCWAFATTATIESNLNIYFNRLLDYNLSEQELVSCLDNDGMTVLQRYWNGNNSMYALDYVKRKSIVKEDCFPFSGIVSCDSICENPLEKVSFQSFRNLNNNNCFDTLLYTYNDSISYALRKAVIKHPILLDYFKSGGHSVLCVGFHKIQYGDTLCGNAISGYEFVVDSTTIHFVNQLSCIIKNSWGEDWGENGYARVTLYTVRLRLYELNAPFTSMVYSDNDRFVTDSDDDGYYVWGSGIKPNGLPCWIPDSQDADDNNSNIGPITDYGTYDTLNMSPAITWYVDANYAYSITDSFTYPNIVIAEENILSINNAVMTMKDNATIVVNSGASLIIDGGTLKNANIIVNSGGSLTILNNGTIELCQNGQVSTAVGALVNIDEGIIAPYCTQ